MLHGGRNAKVAMAAVLGACSRALVARSRSDAVTARNGEMMERAKDRDDRDSMAMTAFIFTMAGKEDEGEEDEMEHLASVSWQWEGEEKLGAVDTSWSRNLITAGNTANIAATLPPIHHLADM
uniref:Uncharacterized protein n=1 Tax=Oryza barthii TaxID=65489 RepID=A0A0D3GTC2_9ORYZ